MNPVKKKVLAVAAACVAAGLVIAFIAFAALDFKFYKLGTMEAVTHTYTPAESFTNITIFGAECDVRLVPSSDGTCTVVCNETDRITHHVSVENGNLNIHRTDNRRWYEHIGFYWRYYGSIEVILYLPQTDYESIYIRVTSGEVDVPSNFSFAQAEVRNVSGTTHFAAEVAGSLTLTSTSGSVAAEAITVGGALDCETVSGNVNIRQVTCQRATLHTTSGSVTADALVVDGMLDCSTISGDQKVSQASCRNAAVYATSGDVIFSDMIASEHLDIETISGQVELTRCDADSLRIKTVSGDVSGSLCTEKIFSAHSTSGSIRLPETQSGGKCDLSTVSGDIFIIIMEQ